MTTPPGRSARFAKQVDLDQVQDTLLEVQDKVDDVKQTVDGHTGAIRNIETGLEDVRTRVQALQKGQRDQHLPLQNLRSRIDNVDVKVAAVQQVQHEQSELLNQHGGLLTRILGHLEKRR